MQFTVKGSIILLFATDKKWDLENIKLKAVTAQGIFFDAACPALVIDQNAKTPIRIGDAEKVFEATERVTRYQKLTRLYEAVGTRTNDVPFILNLVWQETLALCGDGVTRFEKRFLELFYDSLIKRADYFQNHVNKERDDPNNSRARATCDALMPIPQAWFYCHDPLEPYKFIPENAYRVDFAFWSGEKFYAVEIDGNEPGGYAADVRRDRLLRRAGIDVIHMLNKEIMDHGENIIQALLPREIVRGPKGGSGEPPFTIPF